MSPPWFHLIYRISSEVGMLCKTRIKTEYNDLQILFYLYSIEYITKTSYLMFKLINFVFLQIFTHCLQQVSKKLEQGHV